MTESEIKKLVGTNFFLFLDYCISQEKLICDAIVNGRSDMRGHLEALADNVRSVFSQAPDICLAATHLEFEYLYSACHPIYNAFLALLIAKGLDVNPDHYKSLVLAALTANLGMYEYHDTLVNKNGGLSDDEFKMLKTHPELSHRILVANGVTDQLWLNIVMQHHERGDGTGYPHALKWEKICIDSSILATVDTYLSFIMPRAYRKSIPPNSALQKIYKTAVADDDSLSMGLIKYLGVYPPGSLVLLANNEIAIVVERNEKNMLEPKLACIGTSGGHTYSKPIFRSATSDKYTIIEPYISENAIEIDMNQLWNIELDININTAT